ncbi:glutamyl-tRNA reductase [Nisaea acidiphila]|uniref:Glutamyl-tRNA reductase n=1 Tax=Nisaea acidiphila TaxID=1862145 RepID=A0A9J7AVT9_9PROT|nr:glutamyl-tRNA reductase [Nisaea acidiphila]UUX51424.1 glutamyl-tRNA reductase [Nisaea acidiphila]
MADRPASPLFQDLHRFAVVGVNHRTCPDAIREQLFVADEELPVVLRSLRVFGIEEAMPLSTCDRVEVAGVFPNPEEARSVIARILCAPVGLDPALLEPLLYRHVGGDAVAHLFRVAASLDSQVIGEPQILGQMRAGHRLARNLKSSGPLLDATMSAAFEAARQVRRETRIAEGPVSIAAAAITIARDVHGALDRTRALLLGAGELGLILAEQLQEGHETPVTVMDRISRRAEATAKSINAHHRPFEELSAALSEADIVIAAVGEGRTVLTAEMVESALQKRRYRPIFLVDLSVPADVDPAVNRIDEAFLFDLEDLERTATEGKNARRAEAERAREMVEKAVARFLSDQSGRTAAPAIVRLRNHLEAMRTNLHEEQPNLSAEQATRLLLNRIMHGPSEHLRRLAASETLDDRTISTLVELFGLEEEQGENE